MACSPKTKRFVTFGVAITFLIIGVFAIIFWPMLYKSILTSQLSLSENSESFNMWKETPIPMYLDIYLFNWTNIDEVRRDWSVKPNLVEMGPYVFSEKHLRVNMEWNQNSTITFQEIRTWHFEPNMSNGTLEDNITHLNVISATVGYMLRHQYILIQKGVDLLLSKIGERFSTTKTVKELLFDGYDDKFLDFVKKLNISGINIPYDQFGWFYGRNLSATYDGTFNMYTGADDLSKTGIVARWNGYEHTPYYPGHCGDVKGTTGELWPPVPDNKTVDLFSSDLCSSLPLSYLDNTEIMGISGKHFIGEDRAFDNGKKYPENKCYDVGEHMPAGVRNVSQCRFGAPAFISYPHFYLADSTYQNRFDGIQPNKSKHQLYLVLEPKTGIPLSVKARVQINILLQKIPGISMYKDINETLFPMFWFEQRADLTKKYADKVKLLLVLEKIGVYTGCGLSGLGILIVLIALFITFQKRWKDNQHLKEEMKHTHT